MRRSIKIFAAIFVVFTAVCFFGIVSEEKEVFAADGQFRVYTAYNLNSGSGEIRKYSYRNIVSDKAFESFGVGYGGYFTGRNRWQESPVLIETTDAFKGEDHVFGDKFSGDWSVVGRGIQTLYSEGEEIPVDYSVLTFRFYSDRGEVVVDLSREKDKLKPSVKYNGENAIIKLKEISASLTGKSEGSDAPLYLAFDSYTGIISTRTGNEKSKDKIICDLSSLDYVPMQYFSASLTFGGVTNGVKDSDGNEYPSKGRFLLYELCGQNMTGSAVNTRGAVVTAFGNREEIAVGSGYTPVPAVAYDVLDGDVSSFVNVRVEDRAGNVTELINGRIVIDVPGKYFIVYGVEDSGGIYTEYRSPFEAKIKLSKTRCVLKREYLKQYGVGEKVYISDADVYDGDEIRSYSVVVMKDGVPIDCFENGVGYFIPEEAGIYKAVYTFMREAGVFGSFTYDINCADVPVFEMAEIPAYISYGVPFSLGSPTVLYGGRSYSSEIEITDPDGEKTAMTDDGFIPTKTGEYKIGLSYESAGITHERVFTSVSKLENVDLIVCGENGYKSEDYPVSAYKRTVKGNSVSKELAETSGVYCGTNMNSTVFRVNNAIDFSELSPETPVINLSVLSGKNFEPQKSLSIKLTDKYDRNNYVTVYYEQHPTENYFCYVRAGACGRLYGRSNESGKYDRIWTTRYGTVALNSLCGAGGASGAFAESKYNPFGFYFDYADKKIYIANACDFGYGEYFPVVDLDDPEVVGADGVWNGFTNGEAYIEVSVSGNTANTGAFVMTEVGGYPLYGKGINKKSAPVISVDTIYAPNGMPTGCVGKRYPVPAATVSDVVCGVVPLTVKAYDPDGSEVAIDDGAITAAKAGRYSIIYSSSDYFGNDGSKKYEFDVADGIDPIDIRWKTTPEEMVVGNYYKIPEAECFGGSGEITDAVWEVLYNGEKADIPVTRRIKPDKVGTITFRLLSASDYLGSEIKGTVLTVGVKAPTSTLLEVSGIPDKFVAGGTYYLPEATARDYTDLSVPEGRETGVAVYLDGEEITDRTFVVPDSEKVELKFTAGTAEKIFTVPVFTPEGLSDYFISDSEITARVTDYGIEMRSDGSGEIKFINPVVAGSLQLRFNATRATAPSAITVTLTDYTDQSLKVCLKFTPYSSTQSYMEINGNGKLRKVSGSFDSLNQYYGIMLTADGLVQDVRSTANYNVEAFDNGEKFNGFPGGLVKVSFLVQGGSNRAVYIDRIGNQIFDSYSFTDGDSVGPTLLFTKPMSSGEVDIGEEITVSSAKAYDVLGVYGNVVVRVTAPGEDGSMKILYNNVAADRDITVKAERYGIYSAIYTATDINGIKETYTFRFTVRDKTPPTVVFTGSFAEKYSVGEKLVMPVMKVSDNHDEEPTLVVTVYNYLTTRYETIADGYVFAKGDCRITVVAYDADMNTAEYVFEIKVEG